MPTTIVTFYKFVALSDPSTLQSTLRAVCQQNSIFGTLILAHEGINGTLAGQDESIRAIVAFFHNHPLFVDLKFQYSYSSEIPFKKTKILVKNEIVALKKPHINPVLRTGIHIEPKDWNVLISDPDVTVIDVRNTYEIEFGTFKRALDPETPKFNDFPRYVKENLDPSKHKKIAMYCTGGIRCEKASAYLLEQGFENVYQLQGGILKYLKEIPANNSLWEGKCFIFDNRVTFE